ncbi:MAG: PAS domain-containing protein [Pseudomonadota bacterium]
MEHKERWDDFLIAEHEMIERSMAVLKNCLEKIGGGSGDPVQMSRAIDFLLEFGDKIHNKKEEDFLFPLMQKRGVPTAGGPIGVMLQEHQAERQLLSKMLAELPDLPNASSRFKEEFKTRGFDYLQIRANHIWKENDVLYPLGRKIFKDEDNANLLDSFYRIDRELYGPDAKSHYLNMLDEAEKGSQAKKGLIHTLSYEQIEAIMEALPFEVTFVDAKDTVAYFNRLDKSKIFPRTRSVIGRKVEKCHPEKSVDKVLQIVQGFKNKTMDSAEFWINFRGDKVLIRYFPVYNEKKEYIGVLEVTQSIGRIQTLEGEKRLP